MEIKFQISNFNFGYLLVFKILIKKYFQYYVLNFFYTDIINSIAFATKVIVVKYLIINFNFNIYKVSYVKNLSSGISIKSCKY